MSNDNRTLADVQPRGRVRLGDALPPLPASSVQCLTTGALLFSVEKMKLYALAALSAQPSPGGQDALDCIGRIEEAIEFRVPHDIYAAVHGELAELKAALAARQPVSETDAYQQGFRDGQNRTCTVAARQPVGEPVGRVRTRVDGGFIAELLPGVADRLSNMAPLYLHQPAQAVDLCAAIKAAFPLLTDYGLHHSHCCEYKLIDERHRLHNLIDSQAVGNG
ncbi:hypothetical protein [Stenotrophomonas maltophilia]|uniref:hypothetical protein n=1 Tax=Stenotrophomonas maltophilia TaxID=40324 RepID=UPI0034E22779